MVSYQVPPPELASLITCAEPPSITVSPSRKHFLLVETPAHHSLEQICKDEVRVAGIRFDADTRLSSRAQFASWAKIVALDSPSNAVRLQSPSAQMRSFAFSKDGNALAFLGLADGVVQLYVCTDFSTGKCRAALPLGLMPNSVLATTPFSWCCDGNLLVLCAANASSACPPKPKVPVGPLGEESLGGKPTPARAYVDLLKTPHDEAVFEWFAASQLFKVFAHSLDAPRLLTATPELFAACDQSPDGVFVLTQAIVRPYSHKVPCERFSKTYCVRDVATGVAVQTFAHVPCQEDLSTSFDARPRGPRQVGFAWPFNHTLCFVQALDGGEPSTQCEFRDAVCYVDGPDFAVANAREVARFGYRVDSRVWTAAAELVVTESWFKSRQTRTWRQGVLLWERASEDAYADPGEFRSSPQPATLRSALRQTPRGELLLFGAGASPQGARPFLDALAADGQRRRLWRSPRSVADTAAADVGHEASEAKDEYQRPLDLVESTLLVVAESPTSPPNLCALDVGSPSVLRALTAFPHPQPALLGVRKELVRYQRADGVDLHAHLYLPAGFVLGSSAPLPLLCWAYPNEFKSASNAGQLKQSPHRFVRTQWHSPVLFAVAGFAVLDDFACPVVGEGDREPNDTFVAQLVASAQAAVEAMVRRGVADAARVAVGGHSYGAFMTANLLTHAPAGLFRAGIARSGAYNRTLTPFSFQSEERTYWQATDVYHAVSPFSHAHKLNAPLLLIHGADDPNPGTHVMQSEKYYHALAGLGKKARLIVLPYERHSYSALESCLHVVAEEFAFLCKHLGVPAEARI